MVNKNWIGQWIEYNPQPLGTGIIKRFNGVKFTNSFMLEEIPKTLTVDICGLGFYVLKINGKNITDDILNPAFTAYNKKVFYNTYDITKFVTSGENSVEVCLGNGWFLDTAKTPWEFTTASWATRPQLICEFFADDKLILKSDSSWMVTRSKTTYNSLRCGETYDATFEEPEPISAFISQGPGGILMQQNIPSIKLQEEVLPVSVSSNKVYDFGKSISGNIEICVEGKRGEKVTIQYAESVDDGNADVSEILPLSDMPRFQCDEYILSGNGKEYWHSDFGYNGFRYAQITTNAKIISVKARCFYTNLQPAGGFHCNNEFFNILHNACIRSIKTNFHHLPTDCPQREKNGWTADAYLSSETAMFNLDMKDAYIKWLDDIVDCQRENGAIPCIAPTSFWGYHWGTGNTWDAVIAELPYRMYCFYGDKNILKRYKNPIKKYIDFMFTMSDNGIWKNGLGDWCAPNNCKIISIPAILTAYAYHIVDLYSKICNILNDTDEFELYSDKANEIRTRFIEEFEGKEEYSQGYLAICIEFGLTNDIENMKKRLFEITQKAVHIECGIHGMKWIFNLLSRLGRSDLAENMLLYEDYPGYKYMLKNGNGTLCEAWNCTSSKNHHMFSTVDEWFFKCVAGINYNLDKPAFDFVTISPKRVKSINNFSCYHIAPAGKISVMLEDNVYTVVLPHGVCGKFVFEDKTCNLKEGENTISIS